MRQGTAELHHEIADPVLPQPDPIFDDPTAFDTVVDRLEPQPALGERLMRRLLLQYQLLVT